MTRTTDDHRANSDHAQDGSVKLLQAKKPWHAPLVIVAASAGSSEKQPNPSELTFTNGHEVGAS